MIALLLALSQVLGSNAAPKPVPQGNGADRVNRQIEARQLVDAEADATGSANPWVDWQIERMERRFPGHPPAAWRDLRGRLRALVPDELAREALAEAIAEEWTLPRIRRALAFSRTEAGRKLLAIRAAERARLAADPAREQRRAALRGALASVPSKPRESIVLDSAAIGRAN